MENQKAYVYIISCITTGCSYIGKSINPKERFANHLSSPEKGKTPFYRAISKYGKDAFELSILEECDSEEAAYLSETKWIRNFREQNKPLYNLNDGGEGNFSPCEETLRRMSKAQKGKIISQETKEKISQSLKGKKLSKETLEKISTSLRGRKMQGKQLENIREGAKKRSQDPEWKRKNKEACLQNLKLTQTPECREKISRAQRKYTDENAILAYNDYLNSMKIVDLLRKYEVSTGVLYRMFDRAKKLIEIEERVSKGAIKKYAKS